MSKLKLGASGNPSQKTDELEVEQISIFEASNETISETMEFVQCAACASAYSGNMFCCKLGGYWIPKRDHRAEQNAPKSDGKKIK